MVSPYEPAYFSILSFLLRCLNELVQHLFVAFLWGCRFGPRPWARSQIKARANGDHHGNDATTLTWAVRCTVWRAWI